MFTPKQYREKADQYAELTRTARNPSEVHEFRNLERNFATLADNEQWLTDRHEKSICANKRTGVKLAEEEEHVLRCLGAALIMQWNTLPAKLQRELFDNAGSVGELLDVATLRGQVARFLHKHKDD